jgi:16S rRNA (guanine966-N2)-methyltransferase
VVGIDFWDLCAGIGGYGLEAVSRGATGGVFVEKNSRLCPYLRENLQKVSKSAGGDPRSYKIFCEDIFKLDFGQFPIPRIIFLDPPYEQFRTNVDAFVAVLSRFLPTIGLGALELPADISPRLPAELVCARVLGKPCGKNSPKALILRRQTNMEQPAH